MGLKNLFKKDYIIGLDIGSSSIKMAQFIKKEGSLSFVKADLKEIGRAFDEDTREKEISSAIKYLFKGINTKKAKIIAAINCPQTAIKKVTTPYMPKSELRQGINLEAKNYFPFPIDQSLLDFEILGDIVEKGVRKYEVLVGVCPIITVDKYLEVLEKAGIKPASFVSCSYSLQKLSEYLISGKDETACLVDIGELNTELIISKGRNLMFTRKIPISGSDFTKAMTGLLVSDRGKIQLTQEEAEKIKREVGLPPESDSKIIDDKISTSQILAMLRAPAEHLVNEIERCLDYYMEEAGGAKVNSAAIYGGGASLAGLIRFISAGLGIEVKLGDPLESFRIEKSAAVERERISHRLDMAIGAALSEPRGMNLLPAEIKEETHRAVKRGTLAAIITGVVVIAFLFYIGIKIQIGNFNKRISVAKLEMSSLKLQLEEAEAKRLAGMVLVNEPYWEDVFKELGSLIPNDVLIENIKMENEIITIKGMVSSQDGQKILTDFMIALEKGLFNGVKLVESKNLSDKPGIEFELKCWVDYEK